MAQEEISSLLLKVAVDYNSLEQFAGAMPIVLDVAEAVGQQLNALQIGNPEVFAAKGQALSRALVAGFQAEALGLTFAGGQSIAGIITERVFGKLDPSTATAYVRDVQRVLDNVRLQLPQVDQPLISAASLGSLSNVQTFASGAKNELLALNTQLQSTMQQLSALAQVAVPQAVIKKTPEGGLAFTPTAVQAIGAASSAGGFGQVPQAVTQAFGSPVLKGDGSVNVAQTNAAVQAAIAAAVVSAKTLVADQYSDLEAKKQSLGNLVNAVGLPNNAAALGAVGSGAVPPPDAVMQSLSVGLAPWEKALVQSAATVQSSSTALSQAAQRAADAISKATGSIQDQVNVLSAQAAQQAAFQNPNLRPAIDNYQGGSTEDPQRQFEQLMRGEAISGYRAAETRALLAGINASPEVPGLTRGLKDRGYGDIPDYASQILNEARTFGELRLAFAGFSSDREVSRGFATNTGTNPLLLELVGSARALDFNKHNPGNAFESEKEFLTSGRFAVESISRGPVHANQPIGYHNPEVDIVRLRQLATEYDALERRLALPPPKTEAFDAFRAATLGQPLALGPGVGAGPASAVPPGYYDAIIQARQRRLDRQGDLLYSKGMLSSGGNWDGDYYRPKMVPSESFPSLFSLGSRDNPRIAGPVLSTDLVPLPNPAGGIPGAPQLTRGGNAAVEARAARDEFRALGAAADDARSRMGSALALTTGPAAGGGARGGRRAGGTGFNFGGGGGGRRGGFLDFAAFDDFGPGGAFYGGPGGGGFGRGGGFGGAGMPPPPPPGGFGFPFGGQPGGFGRGGGAAAAGAARRTLWDRLKEGGRQGLVGDQDDGAVALARTATSALRFSVAYGAAYGALRLFTGAFAAGVQGAIQFEDALTDLNIATERTHRSNEAFAFSLANLGSQRGFSAAESVAAGARAIGLFDVVEAPRARQEEVARASLDASSKLAFISGQPLEQVQTQIAGISRSFGVDVMDQERIADVASFIGRRTGRPGGEILQSLGQIGSLGESAGFDLEQVAAIIARLTSTTGQTPQAVSGFLSQVLSKADDPNVQRNLRAVGVNTNGTTLAQQIEELASLDLGREQKNQIIQTFGRGRSGQALGIILEQQNEIQGLAEGARTKSEGLAEKDFNQAVNTVGGQLRVLGSSLLDLATGLASTGILDIFVAMLSAAQFLVNGLDAVVDVFNLIPREARTAAFAIGTFVAALALAGRFGPLSAGLVGFAGRSVGSGFLAGAAGSALAAGRVDVNRALFSSMLNPFVRRGPESFGISTLTGAKPGPDGMLAARTIPGGIAGLSALGTGAIIAAGVALAVGIVDAVSDTAAIRRAVDKAGGTLSTATTAPEFDQAISQAKAAQKLAKDRQDFKFLSKDVLTLGIGNIDALTGADDARAEAEAIEKAATARKEAMEKALESDDASVFQNFDADTISMGLQELGERGLTAADRLGLLRQAFEGIIDKASAASGAVGVIFQGQGEVAGRSIAAGTLKLGQSQVESLRQDAALADPYSGGTASDIGNFALNAASQALGILTLGGAGGDPKDKSQDLRKRASEFQEKLNDPELSDRLSQDFIDTLVSRGKDPALGPVSLNADDVKAIEEGQLEILKSVFGDDLSGIPEEVREHFLARLPSNIRQTLGDFNGSTITPQNIRAFLQGSLGENAQVGKDTALTSGSEAEGAEAALAGLERDRALAVAGAATEADPAKRKDMLDQLRQFDLEILAFRKAAGQSRRDEARALVDLQKSKLQQGDVQGAIALDLNNIATSLQDPTLGVVERTRLEAEQNNLNRQAAQDALATEGQRALNALPVRAQGARMMTELGNAEAKLRTLAVGSLEYEQAAAEIARLQDSFNTYALDLAQAVGQLGLNPNDSAAASRAALRDANARLTDARATQDPLAIARAQRAQQLAAFQASVTDPIELQNAKNRNMANGTGLQDANISLTNAQNDLLALVPGTREYFDKQAEIGAAQRAMAQEQADGAKAARRAGINPGDELANARADVLDAKVDLGLTVRGSKEYYVALNALNRVQLELATQEREAARRTRRLGTDSTDSLTQARQDVQDARERLAEARAQGGDTSKEQQDLEDAQARERAEAFDRTLGDARIANELGQTSNSEYLSFLQTERDRLQQRVAAMKETDEGYRQAVEQLQQIDQAMKAANEQFSGQFNLGDIDVPTPFEVRRQLGLPAGGAAQTTTSVVVNINGGDINAVRQELATYLGPVALQRTPTVTPTRI